MPVLLSMGLVDSATAELAQQKGYHVRVAEVFDILAALPLRTAHDGWIQGAVRQLCAPPPQGHVHVACVLEQDAAVATIEASEECAATVARAEAFIAAEEALLERSELVLRRLYAQGVPRGHVAFVVAPDSQEAAQLSQGALQQALAQGAYVAPHPLEAVLAALPKDHFSPGSIEELRQRWGRPVPRGRMMVVVSLGSEGVSGMLVPPWSLSDRLRGA